MEAAILQMSKGNKLELSKQIFLHQPQTLYNISNYKSQFWAWACINIQEPVGHNGTTGSIAMLSMKMHEHAFSIIFPFFGVLNLDPYLLVVSRFFKHV
jgi:hypothetical protein